MIFFDLFKDPSEKQEKDYLQDVRNSAEASALKDNKMLRAAFEYLETKYVEAWRSTPPKDCDAREKLYLACGVLDKVQEHLNSVINDGYVAKQKIEELRK